MFNITGASILASAKAAADKDVAALHAAYIKGRRCQSEDMQDGLMRFVKKYCAHNPWSMCDLCRAWQNGFDNQLEQWRHDHAKKCPLGVGDPGNHEHCDID